MSKIETVAEIGINANGSIDIAKKMIDVAASAGCDYVKFQKRNIDLVYTQEELDSPRKSQWGNTFRDQKQGLEFTRTNYEEIAFYCKGKIGWFASPWDFDSLKFLTSFPSCKFVKIPSALITDEKILSCCRNFDRKVILSTGMSTMDMIDNAIKILGKDKIYCIMHCTSTYPSKPSELNLNCIKTLKQKYPWAKVGFSNHNPGIIYMPIAAALGAEMIEYHITLDRSMEGSDQASSIEPEGCFKLNKYLKGASESLGDGIKKIYDSELPIIKKLRKV
ncbi:MAG: N-acetylneuraminate synthase family protein [Clostridia bacterium]|jgi:N-acetylneuraminate synthase